MSTVDRLAGLLAGPGADGPRPVFRFGTVTGITGDTVTVTVGGGSVAGVPLLVPAVTVGDVVLLLVSGPDVMVVGAPPGSVGGGGGGDLGTLPDDVAGLLIDVAALQAAMTAVEGDVTTLQGDVTAVEGDITTLTAGLAAAQSAIDALEAATPAGSDPRDAFLLMGA